MPNYQDTLKNKQSELIRKALDGSVFAAVVTADPIDKLTTGATADVVPFPVEYDDLGHLTNDGAQFSREVAQSEITSWGQVTPTRTDITSDTSTLQVTMQETKLLTIGIYTGVDEAAIVADPVTGEVSIEKATRPASKHYRVLSLAEDQGDFGPIYMARFLPRAKVTNYAEQNFGGGDEAVPYGVTFTGEVDSELGYSERWIFGGPGWRGLLQAMKIPNDVP